MAERKKLRSEAGSSSNSGGGNSRGESVVVDVGRRKSSCGYCRSSDRTSISHGLWAHSMTVDDYQALLDRGWRRSGCFLYKPDMERTCCPSYTIRLKASDFVPSKEQRRVSNRMQRFLDGTFDVKKSDKSVDGRESCSHSQNGIIFPAEKSTLYGNEEGKGKQFMQYLSNKINDAVQACVESGDLSCDIQFPKAALKKVSPAKSKLLGEGTEELLFSSNISFQIAASLRRSTKDSSMNASDHGTKEKEQSNKLTPMAIAEILSVHLNRQQISHDLSIRACNGHINFYSTNRNIYFDGVAKVSTDTEESHRRSIGKNCSVVNSPGHHQVNKRRLEIHLKRASFDHEEYELYRRYQLVVHKDKLDHVTESSYRRFLVDTPLVFVPPTGDDTVPPCGFGSFHQQYVIDGHLVAVGVIDILPKCLSSKYLFWDPDLSFLSLGKYSALEEIRWIKENQLYCPTLQYYYLGYYIHSCTKMRYKAAFRPSELLCPLRYRWVPFCIAKPLLDRRPYVVLSDGPIEQNGEALPATVDEDSTQQQQLEDDTFQEGPNDVFMEEDDEMDEVESEDSDEESNSETDGVTEMEGADVGNTLIGLQETRLRYKDLRQAFGPSQQKYIETQLQRYMKVVGRELSERMAYSWG